VISKKESLDAFRKSTNRRETSKKESKKKKKPEKPQSNRKLQLKLRSDKHKGNFQRPGKRKKNKSS
tara:strand:+ start:1648 stop:1845 length:198 start_codon:yes stop_codon:yes gene_type:complete